MSKVVTVHSMAAERGRGVALPITDPGAWRRKVVSLTSRPLHRQGKDTGIHRKGHSVGQGADLDDLVKSKISCHCKNSNSVSFSPYASHYTDCSVLVKRQVRRYKTYTFPA